MNEMTPFHERWQLANYTSVKRFAFWKISAKICNFRVPVYKGSPHMNEMTLVLWRCLLTNYTSGIHFLKSLWKVFLSHMNEMKPILRR